MDRPHWFTHLSVGGLWDCFHLMAIVNKAALTVGVQILVQVPVFCSSGLFSEVALLGHVIFLFSFSRKYHFTLPPTKIPMSPYSCQHLLFSLWFFVFLSLK